jgi:hypothetical protein
MVAPHQERKKVRGVSGFGNAVFLIACVLTGPVSPAVLDFHRVFILGVGVGAVGRRTERRGGCGCFEI